MKLQYVIWVEEVDERGLTVHKGVSIHRRYNDVLEAEAGLRKMIEEAEERNVVAIESRKLDEKYGKQI